MANALVIKVKYGNTLRRFTVLRHEDDTVDMGLDDLRERILGLFNFAGDADPIVTYVDEDGDVVTLGNDEDLADAVRQRLNPLRLEVSLSSPISERVETRSNSGSPTPLRSPRVLRTPSSLVASHIEEALKTIPEPLSNVITNFTQNLMSKATASPVVNELVEQIKKLEQTYAAAGAPPPSETAIVPEETRRDSAPVGVRVEMNTPAANEIFVKENEVTMNEAPQNGLVNPTVPSTIPSMLLPEPEKRSGKSIVELVKDHNASKLSSEVAGPSETAPPAYFLMDLGLDVPVEPPKAEPLKAGPTIPVSGYVPSRVEFEVPQSNTEDKCVKDDKNNLKYRSNGPWGFRQGIHSFPASDYFATMTGFADNPSENMLRTFHRGVICDGCGAHPIVGPRYQSKVKHNFDLCGDCFAKMGTEADYTRLDRAVYRPPRSSLKDMYDHHQFAGAGGTQFCYGRNRSCPMKLPKLKLESRFIKDVTVMDGTIMESNTPFTKIWRMRNSGTVSWPVGTQLVWIGGDSFEGDKAVVLEMPNEGCAPEEELEIAVAFVAPQKTGRYTSYWRMASPSGQKFGQRVWVTIQVHQKLSSDEAFAAMLNLNAPMETSDRKRKTVPVDFMDVESVEPAEGAVQEGNQDGSVLVEPPVSVTAPAPVVSSAPPAYSAPPAMSFLPYPYVRTIRPPLFPSSPYHTTASAPVASSALPDGSMSPYLVPYPTVNMFPFPTGDFNLRTSSAPVTVGTSDMLVDGNKSEEALLKELEEMGFKQIDLNKEVLRRNEYNLDQSLDDLCGASEWDTILEELHEMGFTDETTNRKLLAKNGGSIKRVVLDLINGEK